MYCYIIDPAYIEGNKKEKDLNEIEQRLVTLGISGPTIKIRQFNSLAISLENKIKEGTHTCVAIGNDQQFFSLINAVKQHQSVVIGYIPLDTQSNIASIFDLPTGIEACFTISKRNIVDYSLGIMNNFYTFLNVVQINTTKATLSCDQLFTVKLFSQSDIFISKQNDEFDIVITHQKKRFQKKIPSPSHFKAKNITFQSQKQDFTLIHPSYPEIQTPLKIQSLDHKYHFIMGKQHQIY